ncbi:unnamed protein product, partial [Tuber aestivum]
SQHPTWPPQCPPDPSLPPTLVHFRPPLLASPPLPPQLRESYKTSRGDSGSDTPPALMPPPRYQGA